MKKFYSLILLIFLTACSPFPAATEQSTGRISIGPVLPAKWTQTLTPTVTATPTITPYQLISGVSARRPSDAELKNVKSVWTMVHYRELMAPGSESYYVIIPIDSEWLWNWSFCASPEKFSKYIESIEIGFFIGAQPLREDQELLVTDASGGDQWTCRYWFTILGHWPKDQAVNLEIRYVNRVEANDGKNLYPAGEYSQLVTMIPVTSIPSTSA